MEILVYIGAALGVLGLIGLVICMIRAARIKQGGMEEAEIQAAFQRLAALNMGALFLSVIGLMCIVMGMLLS